MDRMRLPNFMCLGVTKSGTTSLYDILIQHPEIYISEFKEPHFFDITENFKNGVQWYSDNYFKKANHKIIADFTPSYFFDSNAPKRIFETLGSSMKFVVLLRNPVDRAYSHYWHSKRDVHEDTRFLKALEIEDQRLHKYIKKSDYLSYLRHSYINQGLYSQMLERYLEYFCLDNFLFIHFENEFIVDRKKTIKKILNFLEVDDAVALDINIKSNSSSKEISKTLKKIMKRKSWFRKVLKNLIPSIKTRQIIRNKAQRLNNTTFQPPILDINLKMMLHNKYFKEDIKQLERILNKRMNW